MQYPAIKDRCKNSGFTIVELLIVVVLISILAAAIIVFLDPLTQYKKARNSQRKTNLHAISSALQQYITENQGIPIEITETEQYIANDGADLCDYLVPIYIATMPFDPKGEGAMYTDCNNYDTQYTVQVSAGNRITLTAPHAELDKVISVVQ